MAETEIPEDVMAMAYQVYWDKAPEATEPEVIARAILAERERCAQIADYGVKWTPEPANQAQITESCHRIAAAIRRGSP